MIHSVAWRLVGLGACALVLAPLACREDPAPPSTTGGTGGGTGGRGGSGGTDGRSATGGTGGGGVFDAPANNEDSMDGRRPDGGGAGDRAATDGTADGVNAAVMRPFYSHPMAYPAGTIRPGNCAAPGADGGAVDAGGGPCPQATLDQAVASFYDKWKTAYVATIATGDCTGLSYVAAIPAGDFNNQQTLSELQGFGMLATVTMAGHDPMAQKTYDALFNYARRFRSSRNASLMRKEVPPNCPASVPTGTVDSQTDGDLDIALSLLMADRQWGSAGTINYLQEARTRIAAIKAAEMSLGGLPVLGDWVSTGQSPVDAGVGPDPKYSIGLRSSDLMPDHFRAFSAAVTPADAFWMQAIDASHSVVQVIQTNHSMTTGLISDFVVNVTTTPAPAPEDWSTDNQPNDPNYGYLAARVPLRLAADYISSSGEPGIRVKALLTRINDWISGAKTMGNPAEIRDGYELDGTTLGNGGSFLFEGPFGAAAIIDAKYQSWLNAIWARLSTGNTAMPGDSHADTVRLLSLLIMSGNWWAP